MSLRSLNKQSGATLIEIIVVSGIYGFLLIAIFTGVLSIYQYNSYTFAQASEVDQARGGVDRMVRDIREMAFAEDGAYPIASSSVHYLSFYSDIDRDESVEFVEFDLASTTLYKRVYNATGSPPTYGLVPDEEFILSQYVQNLNQGTSTFVYYNVDGDEVVAGDVVDVRYISVLVIVNIDPNRSPGEFSLRSSATLRNLKDNL